MIINTLIIDDDQEVRKTLSSILEAEGYSVEVAENGKKAIRVCEKTPFDVAIIDIYLPDIEGTKLLRLLKAVSYTHLRAHETEVMILGHYSFS